MASNTERAIGQLEGKIDSIIKATEKIDKSLDDMKSTSSDMHTRIESIDGRLKKVEPIAEELDKWRERGIGVLMFVSVVAATVGGAVAAFWSKIIAIFNG
jgi:hypothetical protein